MSSSPPPHIEQLNPISSSTTPSYDPVGIFWDYENCAPSTNASGYNIVDNIRTLASQFGAVNIFKAYLQLPDKSSPRQSTLRSELQSCGLSLTDCPHNGKNSVDLMMIVDIMAFIKDNPPPATVILISGDRDFAYLLSTVRWRKYNVVLVSNSFMTHESLTVQASVVYDWKSDILKTRPPPKPPLPGSRTLSSVASLTTPQMSDHLSEFDAHLVGLPKERVTPTVQPLTLSPRPVGTIPIRTIRPRRATLPSSALSVESEATRVVPKAGTPINTPSASIPMNPTHDDWIVADLAGGSNMDPASPKTIDSVDEDSFHSPAFSSPEMTLPKGEGDIPLSPGRLLLIDEGSSVEPSTHNLGVIDPLSTIESVLRACECKICVRSPVPVASQGLVDGRQVEVTSCEPPTSLPTTALPTNAVPPPELSPTHEIFSNTLTPTSTPKTPHLPRTEVAKTPSEADTGRGFEDLIVVLGQLSANGGPAPRFSTVFSLWKDRKPDAFETVSTAKFKAYLQLAESAGIVAVEQHQDGDGWVTLCHQRDTTSNSPPQNPWLRFHDLIKLLNDLRLAGDSEPQFFTVGSRLLRKNPSIYEDAGVTKFEEYAQAAEEAGVVTIHGVRNGDDSLKLCPAYCSSPVCSSTPTRTADTPPTLAASVASPFAPLVEFLKSKQLTNGQPISFSEVFAHLVSTLGYADLVSLCTSVPGVTNFGQYIDAAIASGLVSLVGGTTASRSAMVSLRDVGPARGVGLGFPDTPSPSVQRSALTSYLPSLPPPPSVNVTPSSFRDLTAVLTELQALTGKSVFRFPSVTPLLLGRRPDAFTSVGVTEFGDYITLAMEKGVVRAGGMDQGAGWVSLSDPRPAGPSVSLQPSKSLGNGMVTAPPPPVGLKRGVVDPKFVDLVETLGEIWKTGEKKPLFSLVGAQLLKDAGKKARTLNACGVAKFKAYAELAKDEGIIEVYYGRPGEERMSLDPTIRVKAGYT